MEAKFRIKMIRFELFMIDCTKFIHVKRVYMGLVKPIFASVRIIFKYLFMIPLDRLIMKFFPKFAEKTQSTQDVSN